MAGWLSNGLPTAGAPTQDGTAQTAPNGVVTQVTSRDLIAVDSSGTSGSQPITYAATQFQVAALAAAMIKNTQTSTVGAATSNTFSGQIVTEALTTAVNATYTMTLTNSLIVAAAPTTQVDIRSGTNTKAGMTLTSVTDAAGSSVFVFTNLGTAAMNGTMVIAWHV